MREAVVKEKRKVNRDSCFTIKRRNTADWGDGEGCGGRLDESRNMEVRQWKS